MNNNNVLLNSFQHRKVVRLCDTEINLCAELVSVSGRRVMITILYKCIKLFIISLILFPLLLQNAVLAFGCKNSQSNVNNVQEKLNYINIDWWNNFSDPILKSYVLQAINCNHDLKKTSWKVEEYRQTVKTVFSKELPSLTVGSYYDLLHFPELAKPLDIKNNIFTVPFLASYEADIFLKNHDRTKSSKKSYCASKFDEKGVYISLVTDVSTVYLNVIKFDKQICLQQQLVEIAKEQLKRQNDRYKRGTVSATDLNNSKKTYESAKSSLDDLIKSRDQALTQLAILIGESPENINCIKRASFDQFEYVAVVPTCIPSDVIFSRPDVLSAEAQLEKAKIDVRVARKEFLPTFNVYGLYSLTNVGVASFGSWNATFAALMAGASLDLFKGGYKVANLKIYKSKYEQMFEAYKQVDLKAIKEVNDSLILINQDTQIDCNTIKNLNIQKDNYNRALNRYKNGVISYPNLLTDKQALILQEQSQVNTKASRLVDYLTLYKAVGGKL